MPSKLVKFKLNCIQAFQLVLSFYQLQAKNNFYLCI